MMAPVQLMGVCVDVLVRQVTPGGVEDFLNVYAIGFGDNQPGPDVHE